MFLSRQGNTSRASVAVKTTVQLSVLAATTMFVTLCQTKNNRKRDRRYISNTRPSQNRIYVTSVKVSVVRHLFDVGTQVHAKTYTLTNKDNTNTRTKREREIEKQIMCRY